MQSQIISQHHNSKTFRKRKIVVSHAANQDIELALEISSHFRKQICLQCHTDRLIDMVRSCDETRRENHWKESTRSKSKRVNI